MSCYQDEYVVEREGSYKSLSSSDVRKLVYPPSGSTSLPFHLQLQNKGRISTDSSPDSFGTQDSTETLNILKPPTFLFGRMSATTGERKTPSTLDISMAAFNAESTERTDKILKIEVEELKCTNEKLVTEVQMKNEELNEIKRHLEAVEKERSSSKQELEALRPQTEQWRKEIEQKMAEVEGIDRARERLEADVEMLRRQLEEKRKRILQLEEELDSTVSGKYILSQENKQQEATIQNLQRQLSRSSRSTVSVGSSYPQLVCHDLKKPSFQPGERPVLSPAPESPEIVWHNKEDISESGTDLLNRPMLATDQYAPLQVWLKKQKMKAAFTGAYAVPLHPAVQSSKLECEGGVGQSQSGHSRADERYLDCPKCDKKFDARDFSSYRRHLEECLT
eukprot:m.80386 g.80386  ORF g.80386 m.80386 type:complete len:393 (+) comp36189_c0_seq2:652-1830(+)